MDRGLVHACAEELADHFNSIFLDREKPESPIHCLSSQDMMGLTSEILKPEKENIKRNISSFSETYISVPVQLKVTPASPMSTSQKSYYCLRSQYLSKWNTRRSQRAVIVDQVYSTVQLFFVSSLLFAPNLPAYSVTRSKSTRDTLEKLHPAGG